MSWPDALIARVGRLPIPAWLFYLILTIPALAYSYWVWTAGAIPGSTLRVPVVILFGAQLVYPLAAAHWLDAAAVRAFARFRPLGMHRRLAAEREAMLEAASARFEAATRELHARVDEMDLSNADPLNKTIASLVAERDVLHHAPTWPWEQATLNTLLTALGAPIVLFFLTRALERLF